MAEPIDVDDKCVADVVALVLAEANRHGRIELIDSLREVVRMNLRRGRSDGSATIYSDEVRALLKGK